ncbi:MAG: hypothetical protein AAFZ65_14705, partial [Planctomycetota bacterium]
MKTLPTLSLLGAAGALIGALAGALHSEPAATPQAGTALRLDTQGLVAHSEWIVEGQVLSRRTVERLDGSLDTEYRLDVSREFLADEGASDTFRLPGGQRADGSGLIVPGLPRLQVGEEALLFLGDVEAGRRLTAGLAQGRYTLMVDRHGVRRAVRAGASMVGQVPEATVRGAESTPYAALVA